MNENCFDYGNFLLIDCQSTCYQKAVKRPQKGRQYLRIKLLGKKSSTITVRSLSLLKNHEKESSDVSY